MVAPAFVHKFIFLDIDGVLNTDEFIAKSVQSTGWGGRFSRPEDHLDPDKIAILNRVVAVTNADIVLSTAWREALGAAKTGDILLDAGLNARIVGATPNRVEVTRKMSMHIPRWLEIHHFLEHTARKFSNFVIVDDRDDAGGAEVKTASHGFKIVPTLFSPMRDNFVQTDPLVGLTDADADKMIEILNKPSPVISTVR